MKGRKLKNIKYILNIFSDNKNSIISSSFQHLPNTLQASEAVYKSNKTNQRRLQHAAIIPQMIRLLESKSYLRLQVQATAVVSGNKNLTH